MKNFITKTSLFFALLLLLNSASFAQDGEQSGDPTIDVYVPNNPILIGTTTDLMIRLGNFGQSNIMPNSLNVTITAGLNTEILGIDRANQYDKWKIVSLTSGTTNTIKLTNKDTLGIYDVGDLTLTLKGTKVGPASLIQGNIGYNIGLNPLITGCDGVGPCPNAWQENLALPNDNSNYSAIVVATLPVKLLDFTTKQIDCAASLSWKVADEKDFSHYEVEQSADGKNFTKVATVLASASTSAAKAYGNLVAQAQSLAYYRLKMIDKNGVFSYSTVLKQSINCSSASTYMNVYPNPVTSSTAQAALNFKVAYKGKGAIWVTNNLGQRVSSQPVDVVSGPNITKINTARFAPGNYYVQLVDEAGAKIGTAQKIIKQ